MDGITESALQQLLDIWQVDEADVKRGQNGFDWLPGSHVVRVRAIKAEAGNQQFEMLNLYETADPASGRVRLSVETDVLTDVPAGPVMANVISAIAPHISSSYALVHPPEAFMREWNLGNEDRALSFFSSIYLSEELSGWLPRFLAQMALMQPIDAEIRSSELPELFRGGRPNYATGQKRLQPDGILEVANEIFVPAGQTRSRWAGTNEFSDFADAWGRSDLCFANGDDTGLTAEVPFGPRSALIRCWTDQRHPQLGSGLLVTTQLPFWPHSDSLPEVACFLNFCEARSWTDFPQFGCWHTQGRNTQSQTLAHSSFIPNALSQRGFVLNFMMWEMARVRWVRETFCAELTDLPMSEVLRLRNSLR